MTKLRVRVAIWQSKVKYIDNQLLTMIIIASLMDRHVAIASRQVATTSAVLVYLSLLFRCSYIPHIISSVRIMDS